jgi:hypothetical protein
LTMFSPRISYTFDLTTKHTKVTKDWEIKTLKLRALRVLRGENYPLVISRGITALGPMQLFLLPILTIHYFFAPVMRS